MTITEATARELIEALKENTLVIKGLTGVLIDDREQEEQADTSEQAKPATYMDGTPRP
jgi:hypothetical protein